MDLKKLLISGLATTAAFSLLSTEVNAAENDPEHELDTDIKVEENSSSESLEDILSNKSGSTWVEGRENDFVLSDKKGAEWIEENFDDTTISEISGDLFSPEISDVDHTAIEGEAEGETWIDDNFDNDPRPEQGGDVEFEGSEWIEDNFDDTVRPEKVENSHKDWEDLIDWDKLQGEQKDEGQEGQEDKEEQKEKDFLDLIDWNKVKDLHKKHKEAKEEVKEGKKEAQPAAKTLPQTGTVASVAPAALGLALAAVGAGFAFRKHD